MIQLLINDNNQIVFVNQYLETVQPMYEEIIGPSQIYADLIINNDGIVNDSVRLLKLIIQDYLKDEK